MADLEALIRQSIDTATETGNLPDAEEGTTSGEGNQDGAGDQSDEGEVGETSSTDTGGDGGDGEGDGDSGTGGDEGVPEKTPSKSESKVDVEEAIKLLEEAGIKAPKEGQRENRIPHSRVLRIIANGLKKGKAAYETEFKKSRDTELAELAQLRAEKQGFDAAQQLLRDNPDEYIGRLAVLFPEKYSRFAEARGRKAEERTESKSPRPTPDVQLQDGTLAYSPEQHDKLLEWVAADAAERGRTATIKELEPRLKQVEGREQAREAVVRQQNAIRTLEGRMTKLYGKLFEEHKDGEVAKAIAAENDAARLDRRHPAPIEDVIASVLVPKLQLTLDQQREKLLKEQDERRAAADKPANQPRREKEPEVSTGDMDMESIIRREVDRAKRAGLR